MKNNPALIIYGSDLEDWRQSNGFTVTAAAEAFGIQRGRWDSIIKENDVITDRRIIRLYFLFTRYPQSRPLSEVNYVDLFKYLGFSTESGEDFASFAKLLGISRSSAYRVIQDNNAGRSVDAIVLALKRMGLDSPGAWLFVMNEIGELADESFDSVMKNKNGLND